MLIYAHHWFSLLIYDHHWFSSSHCVCAIVLYIKQACSHHCQNILSFQFCQNTFSFGTLVSNFKVTLNFMASPLNLCNGTWISHMDGVNGWMNEQANEPNNEWINELMKKALSRLDVEEDGIKMWWKMHFLLVVMISLGSIRNQCSLIRFTNMRKSKKKMNPNNGETM